MIEARDVIDLGAREYTLADLEDEWALSEVELDRDVRVVETGDGRIVAYAILRRRGALVMVAPGYEDTGLGTRLLDWTEEENRLRGNEHHRQWLPASNRRAVALLRGRGYTLGRSYARMVRALGPDEAPPKPPEGIRLAMPDLDRDGAALHALDDRTFATTPDYEPHTFEQFSEEHLHSHDVVPGLSRIALEGETIVGFALACRWSKLNTGFVDILAVEPSAQRRGIGTALLRDCFAAFAAAGLTEARLGVASDNPRAFDLYTRAGMTERFRLDVYERPINDRKESTGLVIPGVDDRVQPEADEPERDDREQDGTV